MEGLLMCILCPNGVYTKMLKLKCNGFRIHNESKTIRTTIAIESAYMYIIRPNTYSVIYLWAAEQFVPHNFWNSPSWTVTKQLTRCHLSGLVDKKRYLSWLSGIMSPWISRGNYYILTIMRWHLKVMWYWAHLDTYLHMARLVRNFCNDDGAC